MSNQKAIKNEADLYRTKNLFFKKIVFKMPRGNLIIGQHNVFHTKIYVLSEGGDIKIGDLNIFEEKVIILNKSKTETMEIGNYNYFNIGTRIYNSRVGSYNNFGMNSYVENCKIGKGNIIGADVVMKPSDNLIEKRAISTIGQNFENVMFNEEDKKKDIVDIIKRTNTVYKEMTRLRQNQARNRQR